MGRMKFESFEDINESIVENPVEVDIEKTIGLIKQISEKLIEINNALSIDEKVENNKRLVDLMGILTQTYQQNLTQSNYDTILKLCNEFNIPN